MELDRSRALFASDQTKPIFDYLRDHADDLGLNPDAIAYFGFPLYKGDDDVLVVQILLLCPDHGAFVFSCVDTVLAAEIAERELELDDVYSHLYGKLLKSRQLRSSKTTLSFGVHCAMFAPHLQGEPPDDTEVEIYRSEERLGQFIATYRRAHPISREDYDELRGVVEGAKGLIRPRKREVDALPPTSKGQLAAKLEQEITRFDSEQRKAAIRTLEGPQRIRGLAGSGKTVVLAMKAAQLHLRHPEKKILYTFSTKSLYQHIQRLITRFYRQFADQDPDWDKLHVLHAWGGRSTPGVYYEVCQRSGVSPIPFQNAAALSKDAFDYVVTNLMNSASIDSVYDYVLVDEGQDFPLSFLKLAANLAKAERFVFAADELQTIFQKQLPGAKEILGEGRVFTEDIVLHKCYRNPREVLVAAHALGFGIYGPRIVQMLEDSEHWDTVGYEVETPIVEGQEVRILRPAKNSLQSISQIGFDEIIHVEVYASGVAETQATVAAIDAAIADGLRPDDILVVCVDDRNAKDYFNELAKQLFARGILTNNVHAAMGLVDFQRDGHVTLSTVHKAKGNEAFLVFVLGVEALFYEPIDKRKRNMLFTAITRTKGWVTISGSGPGATQCLHELKQAQANYPRLVFTYPSAATLELIHRDREDEGTVRAELARKLASGELSDDQVEQLREMLAASGTRRKEFGGKAGRIRRGKK